jgi:hypothetical protein
VSTSISPWAGASQSAHGPATRRPSFAVASRCNLNGRKFWACHRAEKPAVRQGHRSFSKWRDDRIVPLICPTCQNVFAGSVKASMPATPCYFAWGCFRYFRVRRAVARVRRPPSPKWASAWQPSLGYRERRLEASTAPALPLSFPIMIAGRLAEP